MTDELLQSYSDRLLNRTDIWFRQWITPEGGCQYFCVKPGTKRYEPASLRLLQKHLTGEITASWPATNGRGLSKWCCWDSDTDDGGLTRVESVLSGWGLYTLREAKRVGREGHLWLLLDEPVSARDLLRVNQEVIAHAGVALDAIEFFPKSVNRLSQVRGPLGIHRKLGANNQRSWFESPVQDIQQQLEWLAVQPLNAASAIQKIAEALYRKDKAKESVVVPRYQSKRYTPPNILGLVLNARTMGHEYVAQCPICEAEGHDKHADNLRISKDGRKYCCVYGGPGVVHKSRDIISVLLGEAAVFGRSASK